MCITWTICKGAIGFETGSKFQNEISLSAKNRRKKAVENLYIDHSQRSRYRDLVNAWKTRGSETQPVSSLDADLLS